MIRHLSAFALGVAIIGSFIAVLTVVAGLIQVFNTYPRLSGLALVLFATYFVGWIAREAWGWVN